HYPFCGAAKDYETPLGTASADVEFMQALEQRVGERLQAEQFAHKNEHSIEFVAVFLQYLEQFQNARIVPILCGSLHEEVQRKTSPAENADVGQFCIALRDTVRTWERKGQRVGFIASVDLAHVGPNFGDPRPVTPEQLRAIERADREFLACVELGAAEALHAHIARDDNARNVDAHPALYTLLLAFPELRAQLLHYTYADAPSRSIVSFASMALYED
ncbi:MAG: AmmeMemoRadiSam system protein B, partial [Armatimonadota bacterium]|nr:AmmeMemoRadiSam system protein B [Armatimonadota bacterium]